MGFRTTQALGAGIAVLAAGFASPIRALAAGPLGENGSPIATSAYSVDLSQGLVLGGSRAMGLAGAYVALAEGAAGNLYNPAAPAIRASHASQETRVDLGFGAAFPASIANKDYFNSGSRTEVGAPRSEELAFLFFHLAANLQDGPWGGAAAFDFQTYGLQRATATAEPEELSARFVTTHLQLARRFGDLTFGVGSRLTGLTIRRDVEPIFQTTGSALELGAHYRPTDRRFRLGAALRSAVDPTTRTESDAVTRLPNGDVVLPGDPADPLDPTDPETLYIPEHVVLPWEIAVGAAVSLGPRPFNPAWQSSDAAVAALRRYVAWRAAERRRWRREVLALGAAAGRDTTALRAAVDAQIAAEQALDEATLRRAERDAAAELRAQHAALARRYLLLTAAVHVVGPLDDAVGVESFLQRTVNRSGQVETYSPRLGVETEVVPRRLTLRAGSYYEPTRFATREAAPRVHATFGTDVGLVEWKVFGLVHEQTQWRLTGAVDYAERYLAFGAGLGVWH